MKKSILFLVLTAFLASPIFAGVVFEVETTDHSGAEPETGSTQVWAEGKNLKMNIVEGKGKEDGEAIYRGDRREMVIVNRDDKSYMVIDKEAIEAIGGQFNQAMQQMQETLKDVPEDQRALIEQMMKKNMPQQQSTRPKTDLRKTSERAEHGGYPCIKYEVHKGNKKIRELWVTDWKNIEGGTEVAESFVDMATFFESLLDSLSSMAGMTEGFGDSFDVNAFMEMKDLDGFPVVTREFDDDGSLENEATLRSATRRKLDPAEFEPPSGYKRRQMF